jgi:hypothetical protein
LRARKSTCLSGQQAGQLVDDDDDPLLFGSDLGDMVDGNQKQPLAKKPLRTEV